MVNQIGAGNLFPENAKSIFLQVTGERYQSMLERVRRKGYPGLPFDKDAFRECVLKALGGHYDGFLRCRYCNGYFSLEQAAVDHAVALARGGGIELDNLEFPCAPCNWRKGKMKPEEYLALLGFLDTKIPLAKTDVLERLEKAVQMARGFSHLKAKEKAREASSATA
jgi:hypothetical protein